jgi:hypothetical protein
MGGGGGGGGGNKFVLLKVFNLWIVYD